MKKETTVYIDSKSHASEMFRTLRTNIQFMNSNKNLKTLLVTSTLPEEGKSWISANLAIAFAQTGKKVLLVDADMRKGRQFNIFGVSPIPGLSNYLSGVIEGRESNELNLDSFIQKAEIENLYIMPAGNVPPNPSELLVSERMLNLINELKESFDITIFDGTPSLILADAPILSRIVDSTIIVTAYNETKMDNIEKVKKSIEGIGGNISGVVINKVPLSSKRYENLYYGSTYQIKEEGKDKNKKENKINIKEKFKTKIEKKQKQPSQKQVTDVQDILDQIQSYLDEEKKKLKNGDNK